MSSYKVQTKLFAVNLCLHFNYLLNGSKKETKRSSSKIYNRISVNAYSDILREEEEAINTIILQPIRGRIDEYMLWPYFNITDTSVAFPYDRLADLLPVVHIEVDFSMLFTSLRPLVTRPLLKDEFIT